MKYGDDNMFDACARVRTRAEISGRVGVRHDDQHLGIPVMGGVGG